MFRVKCTLLSSFDFALLAIVESVRKDDGSPQRKQGKEFSGDVAVSPCLRCGLPIPSAFRGFFAGALKNSRAPSGAGKCRPDDHSSGTISAPSGVINARNFFSLIVFGSQRTEPSPITTLKSPPNNPPNLGNGFFGL